MGGDWGGPAAAPLQGDPGTIGLYVGSFVLVCCCWPVWACLYPLAAGAGVVTFVASLAFIHQFSPSSGLTTDFTGALSAALFLASVIAAIALLFIVSRREHTLARIRLYRYSRHVVRLPLLALLAVWGITDRNPLFFSNPLSQAGGENAEIFVGAILFWHLLLWKGAPVRRLWHGVLRYSGLRPKNLE